MINNDAQCCVCRGCGSILSPNLEAPSPVSKKRLWTCRVCDSRKHVETIAVPYVFRYLVAEMFAMNMRLTLEVK
jgi:DNA-directed RNA polymerase I subunit RPA2